MRNKEEFYYYTNEEALSTQEIGAENESIERAYGVTKEMCQVDYWKQRTFGDADRVLMDHAQIAEINQKALATKATNMHDLKKITDSYDATTLAQSLSNEVKNAFSNKSALYIDGEKLPDFKAYLQALSEKVLETSYKGIMEPQYAVGVARTDVKICPVKGTVGYSATDPDDENDNAALCVNEPFVIKQMCEVDGEVFYLGYTNNCSGWVAAKDVAICNSYEEWLSAWDVSIDSKDFVVVAQDKIILEPSISNAYASEVKLTLGTILKLVSEEERKEAAGLLGERNTNWQREIPGTKIDISKMSDEEKRN